MMIKKTGGKIYGADLTAAEKKAMYIEIQRQLVEYERKHSLEVDALILWQLHEQLGLGPTRLKRFYDNFIPAMEALLKRYETETEPNELFACTYELKKYGIDVERWHREMKR